MMMSLVALLLALLFSADITLVIIIIGYFGYASGDDGAILLHITLLSFLWMAKTLAYAILPPQMSLAILSIITCDDAGCLRHIIHYAERYVNGGYATLPLSIMNRQAGTLRYLHY